jgi:hypothetical protein
VLQSSVAATSGSSRSLRWINGSSEVDDQYVRIRSLGCGADCTASDRYRLRAFDTTGSVARFNASATQATVTLLQNLLAVPVSGSVFFWGPVGNLLHEQPFTLQPHAEFTYSTSSNPVLIGQSGSITVAHDAGYGGLAGKAVSLEAATAFTFDTPFLPRPR